MPSSVLDCGSTTGNSIEMVSILPWLSWHLYYVKRDRQVNRQLKEHTKRYERELLQGPSCSPEEGRSVHFCLQVTEPLTQLI